ncbi:MAG: 23S rRNA (uracil(1939)-C(5))-methyltransferase RlmD [Ectothiorhodospiraceae bacterium]|nr:23S rRNA (uracil(1939)-C(5))-methyltransferase RlmD [Ectothiorhodospiraceae bacterium]
MSRRRRKKLPVTPVRATIESLSHDGRGISHIDGKVTFISRALPGEEIMFRYTSQRGKFDEGDAIDVLEASPQRIEPRCPHFGVCGGCSLQHLSPEDQIAAKQSRLTENLTHLGKVTPGEVLPPLTAEPWGYRRKARLGVKYMRREKVVRVGFREKHSAFLTDAKQCDVLHEVIGSRLTAFGELVNRLSVREKIPQIEVAVGDTKTALIFRHLEPLTEEDEQQLCAFGEEHQLGIFVQPKGPKTVRRLWPFDDKDFKLSYELPAYDIEIQFQPADFTQVNAVLNRSMIDRAIAMLELTPEDRVLDLFCGLGNFSLPLARKAGAVVGVEGEATLVERARENAQRNGITNVEFYAADLNGDLAAEPWYGKGFNKLLLDPPRSGASVVVENLPQPLPERIVYVSCDPATLARDAGILVNQHGYTLVSAGVMDMFPHTAHVESIALFVKS